MYAQTLPSHNDSSGRYQRSARQADSRYARAKGRAENVTHTAGIQPAAINDLLVVLAAHEPNRDVASRAELIARDTSVARTVLLSPDSPKWKRSVDRISNLRSQVFGIDTDIAARIPEGSSRLGRTRIETCTAADHLLREGGEADLVVVGRRRTFPWILAPLARYARRLLRRTRTPMLVVGSRAIESYRNVLIATDLETDIGPALRWARHIAPKASFTFLHVYRGLFESNLQYAGVSDANILEHRLAAQREAASGLTSLLNRHRSINRALLAHGSAVHEVLRKSRELDADLIVVVKSTHSWWAEALGASVSVEIATRADRDVLVVHGAGSRTFGVALEEGKDYSSLRFERPRTVITSRPSSRPPNGCSITSNRLLSEWARQLR